MGRKKAGNGAGLLLIFFAVMVSVVVNFVKEYPIISIFIGLIVIYGIYSKLKSESDENKRKMDRELAEERACDLFQTLLVLMERVLPTLDKCH